MGSWDINSGIHSIQSEQFRHCMLTPLMTFHLFHIGLEGKCPPFCGSLVIGNPAHPLQLPLKNCYCLLKKTLGPVE